MPATSKAQQQAAGIAHAVEKGELPKNKLRGASKQMYRGMKGTGELHKFAATKTGGLPKHASEGADTVARLFGRRLTEMGPMSHTQPVRPIAAGAKRPLPPRPAQPPSQVPPEDEQGQAAPHHAYAGSSTVSNARDWMESALGEGRHKPGCQCGFCKNMGSFGKKKDKDKEPDEPKEPEVAEAQVRQVPYVDKTGKQRQVPWVSRDKQPPAKPPVRPVGEGAIPGQVKLSKGSTLGAANKAYHGMTSKQAMTPEWKPEAYMRAAAEATNQTGRMQGFKNQSQGEDTGGKKLPKTRPGESKRHSPGAKQIVEALLG